MNCFKKTALAVIGTFGLGLSLVGQTPAPTVDRIGFPTDYATKMNVLYVFDRADNRSVRTIYANDPVFTVAPENQNNYPYGSTLVMETWRALQDAQGVPILDARGRFQKDPAATPTLFVMKKDRGFGAEYGPNRNGEWEYVAYRPNGSYQTTPQASFACAICHLQSGPAKDWVFRAGLRFHGASGAVPAGVMRDYRFVPGSLRVAPGGSMTLYNDDVVAHNIVDDAAGGFATGEIKPGSSVEFKFPNTRFEWTFHCSIHPSMRGTVSVQ